MRKRLFVTRASVRGAPIIHPSAAAWHVKWILLLLGWMSAKVSLAQTVHRVLPKEETGEFKMNENGLYTTEKTRNVLS